MNLRTRELCWLGRKNNIWTVRTMKIRPNASALEEFGIGRRFPARNFLEDKFRDGRDAWLQVMFRNKTEREQFENRRELGIRFFAKTARDKISEPEEKVDFLEHDAGHYLSED